MNKKIIIAGAVLTLLGGSYFFKPFGVFKGSDPVIKTTTIKKTNLSTTINASGVLQSENQATIPFLSGGRVAGVNFKEGEEVKKGQIIASLDTTESYQSVSKAEATLWSAQSAVDKVLDDTRLWQYGNGGTKGETQTQKNSRETAEAARDIAYRNLQIAKKELEWSTIVAPFDGLISKISNIKEGQNVSAATGSTVTIMGTTGFKFMADVDEIEFRSLALGQEGEVILDAFPTDKFIGKITKIGVAAVKLSTGGSVIPVEITLNDDPRFKNGFNGEVNFTTVTKENVLVLPKTAIHKNGGEYVYILSNGKPVKKGITSGESAGNQIEIVTGLGEGENVVLSDVKQ